MTRRILVLAHPERPAAIRAANEAVTALHAAGITSRVQADVHPLLSASARGATECSDDGADAASSCELVVVLGGDGTILRGAELARPHDVPLLGVNLGHVGFLAEVEQDDLDETVQRIVARDYRVEDRMTLDVVVRHEARTIAHSWALNEISVEKAARERMLEVALGVDGRPLSSFGCDGVVVATPTGSTAYAFSAGGPVVWPQVEALLVVPTSAHALFARPLVLDRRSQCAIEVIAQNEGQGIMWCDGRRPFDLPIGARIEVACSDRPVRLARVGDAPFADRLVAKFDLNVEGWRGMPRGAGARRPGA